MDLERLLIENYGRPPSAECQSRVLEFIAQTDTLNDRNLHFIHKLTRVTQYILQNSPQTVREHADRIFGYNIEAIERISLTGEGIDPNLKKLKMYFRLKAGEVALFLFEQTHEVSLVSTAYNNFRDSAELGAKEEPKHAAHCYGLSAKAAKSLFYVKRNTDRELAVQWATTWFENEVLAAESAPNIDNKFIAFAYVGAGNAAKECFRLTGSRAWAMQWHDSYTISGDLTVRVNPAHAGQAYALASEAAMTIFQRNHDPFWTEKSYEDAKKSAEAFSRINPNRSSTSYGYAGDAAKLLFEKKHLVNWAKEWYHCRMKSAEIAAVVNQAQAVYSYRSAAIAAKAIFESTGIKEWAQKAIEANRLFLSKYDRNKSGDSQKTIRTVESELTYLQRSLRR